MIRLSGQLIAANEAEAERVRLHLPDHIALTRAEPGCVSFEANPISPRVWQVAECFTDQAAFDSHMARSKASPWGPGTEGIKRDYKMTKD